MGMTGRHNPMARSKTFPTNAGSRHGNQLIVNILNHQGQRAAFEEECAWRTHHRHDRRWRQFAAKRSSACPTCRPETPAPPILSAKQHSSWPNTIFSSTPSRPAPSSPILPADICGTQRPWQRSRASLRCTALHRQDEIQGLAVFLASAGGVIRHRIANRYRWRRLVRPRRLERGGKELVGREPDFCRQSSLISSSGSCRFIWVQCDLR